MGKLMGVGLALVRKSVNQFFLHSSGGDSRPRISASHHIFPCVRDLEARFSRLQSEIDELLNKRELDRYEDIDPVRAPRISNDWQIYHVYMLGIADKRAEEDCPTLLEFARKTPGVVGAAVSVLEAGVSLAAHTGPNAGLLRYHLCVRTPRNNPPRLRVDNEYYTWKEGESIVIDDTFEHEVWSESDETRTIVIIDFRRPMGIFANALNRYWLQAQRNGATYRIRKANREITV
jgi:aspartyl/asparaginyl beta-hydroxylase (cupin superfamily)